MRPCRLAICAAGLIPLLALGGCQTTNTTNLDEIAGAPPPGMARLVITRPAALQGMALPVIIEINGAKAADLSSGGTFTTLVKPGTVVVAASMPANLGRYSVTVRSEAGKKYALVVSPRSEAYVAGFLGGLVGTAIDVAVNENSGPVKITLAN